ncbi:MAG: family 16 glycoside hydrolase [Planctomycetota bacterium]
MNQLYRILALGLCSLLSSCFLFETGAEDPAMSEGAGTPDDGTAKDGAAKDGAAKDGAAKDGAAKDGAARDGAAKNGAAKDGGDGFVTIFDGKSLAGWEPTEGTKNAWVVEDGAIVGYGDKGRGYLTYEKKDIRDLEMKMKYRFPGNGNSGVSIRAVKDETGKRDFKSYHADIGHLGIGRQVLGAWDFHTPGRREHACLRGDRLVIDKDDKPTLTKIDGAVTKDDIKKNDWNDLHIIAVGDNFKFFINGKPAAEFTEHLDPAKRLDRGMIQLQLHDPGMIVQFKDIELKVLD